MFFVNQRWLGGLLTNFTTIQRSLARLRDLEAMETDGRYETLSKKEIAQVEKEKRKLQKNLEGIRHMSPAARRALRRRHAQGKDRGRRGAQAEDPGHRRRRHQLRSRRSRLRDPRQRRRAARDPAVRVEDRRRGDRRPRHRASRAQADDGGDGDGDDRGRALAPEPSGAAPNRRRPRRRSNRRASDAPASFEAGVLGT